MPPNLSLLYIGSFLLTSLLLQGTLITNERTSWGIDDVDAYDLLCILDEGWMRAFHFV